MKAQEIEQILTKNLIEVTKVVETIVVNPDPGEEEITSDDVDVIKDEEKVPPLSEIEIQKIVEFYTKKGQSELEAAKVPPERRERRKNKIQNMMREEAKEDLISKMLKKISQQEAEKISDKIVKRINL